jgi:hypothetical protein
MLLKNCIKTVLTLKAQFEKKLMTYSGILKIYTLKHN